MKQGLERCLTQLCILQEVLVITRLKELADDCGGIKAVV
jgi:hypothetical protein